MKIGLDPNKYNIGRNVRQYRLESKLTQEETIAKLESWGIQMSRGTYSHIECGLDNIRVKALLALAEIFGVEAGDFFEGISLRIKCSQRSGDTTHEMGLSI